MTVLFPHTRLTCNMSLLVVTAYIHVWKADARDMIHVVDVVSLFEFAKTKRTELSTDKGANDERNNHYASKHLRAK